MKKLICTFISVAFMKPFGSKRFVYLMDGEPRSKDPEDNPKVENDGTKNIDVANDEEAKAATDKVKTNIAKGATEFEQTLANMSEEELVKIDIPKFADIADKAIFDIAAQPLKSTILDEAALAPYKDMIATAYEEGFQTINRAKEFYENRKQRINNAMTKITEGIDYALLGNKLIDRSIRVLDIVFNTDQATPADMQTIKAADSAVKKIEKDIGLNRRAVTAMGEIYTILIGPAYEGLTIAKSGAIKVERDQTSLHNRTEALSAQTANAREYVEALKQKAAANGKQDAELYGEAAAAKEKALKKRASLPQVEMAEDKVLFAIPEDAKYGPQRLQEDNLQKQGTPLPDIEHQDASNAEGLAKGEKTIIRLYDKPVTISRNEDGDYELPNGRTFNDVYAALFEARMQAWKEKHSGDDKKKEDSPSSSV